MNKPIKNIILALFILATAAVLSGGLIWYVYSVQHPFEFTKKITEPVQEIDPEAVLDEVVQESGINYTKTVNEDFSTTYEFHIGNVQYLTDEGEQAPIDTTVVESEKEEYAYENTTNVFKSYFGSETGENEKIKYEVAGGHAVEFSFINAVTVEARAEGNTVTYAGAYEGMDAKYTVTEDTFLEEFIVKEKPELDEVSQKVTLHGVYYKEQSDGSITFHDIETKNIAFWAPRPVMYELEALEDTREQHQPYSYGLHYEVTQDEDDITITKVLDKEGKAWLESANYPVAIDATYTFTGISPDTQGFVYRQCNDYQCDDLPITWGYEDGDTTTEQAFIVAKQWNRTTTGMASRTFFEIPLGGSLSGVNGEDIVQARIRLSTFPFCFKDDYSLVPEVWQVIGGCSSIYPIEEYAIEVYTGTAHSDYNVPISGGGVTEDEIQTLYGEIGAMTNYEGTIVPPDLVGVRYGGNQTYCIANPADCTTELDVGSAAIVGRSSFNLGLLEDAMSDSGGPHEYNWHGAGVFNSRASAELEPVLTVVVMPKPIIEVLEANPDEHSQLRIEITDTSNDEQFWELEHSLDGESGWTNVCQAFSGTYTDEPCSSERGTYTCDTTVPGDGGTCVVTITDLPTGSPSDREHFFRARTFETFYSIYSEIDSEWTVAREVNPTLLDLTSPAWDKVQVNGTGMENWYDSHHNQESYTEYAFIIMGQFPQGYETYVIEDHDGDYIFNVKPGIDFSYKVGYWIFYSGLGNQLEGNFLVHGGGTDETHFYPGADYWLCEWARDTRPPNNFHNPGFNTDICDGTYTPYRLPSAPVMYDSTENSFDLAMDITPYDSRPPAGTHPEDAAYTNFATASYAMLECKDDNNDSFCDAGPGDWEYMYPSGGAGRYSDPQWGVYDSGTPDWGGAGGKTFSGFEPATCYIFKATTQNNRPHGGIAFEFGDGYADYSPTARYCTPLAPPDAPTVACDYNETDEYYCDVTINDTNNLSPPYYYKVEVSNDGSAGWTVPTEWQQLAISDGDLTGQWSNDYQDGGKERFYIPINECSTDRYYRVFAAQDASGTSASSESLSGTDTLPPCQPGTPQVDGGISPKGDDYIRWTWIEPATSGETLTNSILYDSIISQTYEQAVVADDPPPQTQSGLEPNSNHIVKVRMCNRSGPTERCGAWSPESDKVYTHAERPGITVTCDYDDVSLQYHCDITIDPKGNPIDDTTKYYLDHNKGDGIFYPFLGWSQTGLPLEWRTLLELHASGGGNYVLHSPITCDANYYHYYRVKARNFVGEETVLARADDYLPPCQSGIISHTNPTDTLDLNWSWLAPTDGEPIEPPHALGKYRISTSGGAGCDEGTTDQDINTYTQTSTNHNTQCTVSIQGRGKDTGRLGAARSDSKYTAIEDPVGITFYDGNITDTQIELRHSATLSNISTANSGVRYFQTVIGAPGGGADIGFGSYYPSSNPVTDDDLSPNRLYCYQTQARNGDGVTGDYSTKQPVADDACRYTHARVPKPPNLTRHEGDTEVTIVIDITDGNSHGEGGIDTQYAVCVTSTDDNNNEIYSHYVDPATGTIDKSFCDLAYDTELECLANDGNWTERPSCDSDEFSGYWRTYSEWGGSTGLLVDLVTAGKYDFMLKARNGNASVNQQDSSGCTATTCIETDFGPPATLFLVKNNVVGWAWSSNIGWLSMNCLNFYSQPEFGYSCHRADDWGLNTTFEPTREINPLEGYAWSSSGQALRSGWQESINISDTLGGVGVSAAYDSQGNPHIVWTEIDGYFCENDVAQSCTADSDCTSHCHANYVIKYLKWSLLANDWVDYNYENDGITDNNIVVPKIRLEDAGAKCLYIEYSEDDRSVQIALDTNDNPHLLWRQETCAPADSRGAYYQYWDGAADVWKEYRDVSDACDQTLCGVEYAATIAVDNNNFPHIAWHKGSYDYEYIEYRHWDNDLQEWITASGDTGNADVQVDQTVTGSTYPSLRLSNDAVQRPHIAWEEWEKSCSNDPTQACHADDECGVVTDTCEEVKANVYYRYWDPAVGEWVTASGVNDGDEIYIDADLDVSQISPPWPNGGLRPNLALDSDDKANIAYNGYSAATGMQYVYFRKWDNIQKGWVTVSGDPTSGHGGADLMSDPSSDSVYYSQRPSLVLDDQEQPHIAWGDRDDHDILYRYWSDAQNAWATVSGDTGDTNRNVSRTAAGSEFPYLGLDPDGTVHAVWRDRLIDDTSTCGGANHDGSCVGTNYPYCRHDWDWNDCTSSDIMYTKWSTEPVPTGLGWISFNRGVCSHDTQQSCDPDIDDCGVGNTCDVSAGTTPDTVGYGYCFSEVGAVGVTYGICSNDSSIKCEADTQCGSDTDYCLYHTCQTGLDPTTCPNDYGTAEECRAYTTASFNGSTREILGWARVLSQKEDGEARICEDEGVSVPCEWGWINLNGEYDDGIDTVGEYNLSGTEVDSQLFLGDPDVNPQEVQLYSLFGWGRESNESYIKDGSQWLNPVNITNDSSSNFYHARQDSSIAIDSKGDPHVAWSHFNESTERSSIYYMRLNGGKWVTITGVEVKLDDPTFDPLSTNLDVGYGAGLMDVGNGQFTRFPSLALDGNDIPHIAGQYNHCCHGGGAYEGGDIFYTTWSGGNWKPFDLIDDGPSQTPSIALDSMGVPHVAYRYGDYHYIGEILLKKWDGNFWRSITGDDNNLSVSDTPHGSSAYPKLVIEDDFPCVTFTNFARSYDRGTWTENVTHVFYKEWNGTNWVSASDDTGTLVCSNDFTQTCTVDAECGAYCSNNSSYACSADTDCGHCSNSYLTFCTDDTPCGAGTCVLDDAYASYCASNRCISIDTSVSWGIRTCDGDPAGIKCAVDEDCAVSCQSTDGADPTEFNGDSPALAFYSNGRPGVVWRDPYTMLYRQWSGTAWVDADPNDGSIADDLVISNDDEQAHAIQIDKNGNPNITWTQYDTDNNKEVVLYTRWDPGNGWATIDGTAIATPGNPPFNAPYKVSNDESYSSRNPVLTLDRWGNSHLLYKQIRKSTRTCGDFDGNGVIDGFDGIARDVEVDEENNVMYVVGRSPTTVQYPIDSSNRRRVEKRHLGSGLLCTDSNPCDGSGFGYDYDGSSLTNMGYINWSGQNANDAWNVALDETDLYVAGITDSGGANSWWVAKYRQSDGWYDSTWGNGLNSGGYLYVPEGDATLGLDIQVDDSFLYIAGYDDNNDWRIEKRWKSNGDRVVGFGGYGDDPDGVITISSGQDARKLVIDDSYMYVVGYDDDSTAPDPGDWRIEKRLLTDGSLVSGFGSSGVITGPTASHSIYDLTIDSDYIYIAGRNDYDSDPPVNPSNWLIGKYRKDNGNLCTSSQCIDGDFDGDGFVTENTDFAYGISVQNGILYITGQKGGAWHYEKRDAVDGSLIAGSFTDGWQDGIIAGVGGRPFENVLDSNYIYAVGNSVNKWRIEKRWLDTGILDTGNSSGVSIGDPKDCIDPEYPVCMWTSPDHECIGINVLYTRWTPGNVRAGTGWLEFMPIGALLGVPWVQTMYSDIYATGTVELAPPPRGIGEYTSTFLILAGAAGDSISGISGYYSGAETGPPTSGYYQQGFDPLISDAGYPLGEDALSLINVDKLVNDDGTGKNRYGHTLYRDEGAGIVDISAPGSIFSTAPDDIVLDGAVYYFAGADSYVINNDMLFKRGTFVDSQPENSTAGNGLIVIEGDLEINANIRYEAGDLIDISEMPSLGVLVRGNTYISPFAEELVGAFISVDNDATTEQEGIMHTSRKAPEIAKVSAVANDAYVAHDDESPSYFIEHDEVSASFGKRTNPNQSYFQKSMEIHLDPGALTTPLVDFPVMIHVDGDAAFTDFWANLTDVLNGYDIDFADPDGTPLDFHLEKFVYGDREMIAWVKVPELTVADSIWMYYGRLTPIDRSDEKGTYNDNYAGVWHLSETGTDVRMNSTSVNGIDAIPYDFEGDEGIVNGKIAGADQYDGVGGYLDNTECATVTSGDYLDASSGVLSGNGDFTVEAWFKILPGESGVIVQQRDETYGNDGTYRLLMNEAGKIQFYTAEWLDEDRDENGSVDGYREMWTVTTPGTYDDDGGVWHHVVAVQDASINGGILYIDGIEVGRDDNVGEYWGIANIDDRNRTMMGVDMWESWPCYKADEYLNGSVDEVRISNTARSSEWVRVTHLSENDALVNSWGTEEDITNRTDRAFLRWEFGQDKEIDIPPGSEIRNAYIKLHGDGQGSAGSFDGKIFLIDYANLYAFDDDTVGFITKPQTLFDIATTNGITQEISSVTWDNNGENTTPNIKSLIQKYIGTDTYATRYYENDPLEPLNFGVVLNEGNAEVGEFRSFYTYDEYLSDPNHLPPELVIEYAPRRTVYGIDAAGNNEVVTWGETEGNCNPTGDCDFDHACQSFGSYFDGPYRLYLRLSPPDGTDPDYPQLPANAEIMNANLKVVGNDCNADSIAFQGRVGLLKPIDIPSFTNNPNGLTTAIDLSQEASEVAWDVEAMSWQADTPYVLPDISSLITAWVDQDEYLQGNDIGLRLRRGKNEATFAAGESRPVTREAVTAGATQLWIDYKMPLNVSGLFVAEGYNFDRKYTKNLAAAEQIVYDGRVVANTPPGLSDFTKALPIYQRVTP